MSRFLSKSFLMTELCIVSSKFYFRNDLKVSVIYRFPSQTNDESEAFLSNIQMLLNDINNREPSLSVITGDFIQDVLLGGLMI